MRVVIIVIVMMLTIPWWMLTYTQESILALLIYLVELPFHVFRI